ncbi:MAG: hypothetical protein O2951_14985 [Bacteroidetes bacterium]|nr:hypothetical protein [Bacteroidota bacterium]
MKVIVVLGIKEYQEELVGALKKIRVPVFSKIEIQGIHNENLPVDAANWFGGTKGGDSSVMFFALVSDYEAGAIMDNIEKLNTGKNDIRPFHAFQMPVERFV